MAYRSTSKPELTDHELGLWERAALAAIEGRADTEYNTRKVAERAGEIADALILERRARAESGIQS